MRDCCDRTTCRKLNFFQRRHVKVNGKSCYSSHLCTHFDFYTLITCRICSKSNQPRLKDSTNPEVKLTMTFRCQNFHLSLFYDILYFKWKETQDSVSGFQSLRRTVIVPNQVSIRVVQISFPLKSFVLCVDDNCNEVLL